MDAAVDDRADGRFTRPIPNLARRLLAEAAKLLLELPEPAHELINLLDLLVHQRQDVDARRSLGVGDR